jgi:hypothetical protein
MEDTIPNPPKERREYKKAKNLEKNLGTSKVNMDMVNILSYHAYKKLVIMLMILS